MSKVEIVSPGGTMERKEFLKQVGVGFGAIMLMQCLQSCSEGTIPDPVGPGNTGDKLDISINITEATYAALQNIGGSVKISNPEKIIVARAKDGSFVAVSSTCTHQGTTINFRPASDDFKCPNHQAEFKLDGSVQAGPATSALKRYKTTFTVTTNVLRITE